MLNLQLLSQPWCPSSFQASVPSTPSRRTVRSTPWRRGALEMVKKCGNIWFCGLEQLSLFHFLWEFHNPKMVCGLEILFFHVLGDSESQLTNSYLAKGVLNTNQMMLNSCPWCANPVIQWTTLRPDIRWSFSRNSLHRPSNGSNLRDGYSQPRWPRCL